MLGAQYLYEATGDEKYINCIRTFMDRYIQEDGTIRYYVPEDYNLDKVNNGRVLYFLYDQTGEEKYKIALSHIREQLETHPRTDCGSFWHKPDISVSDLAGRIIYGAASLSGIRKEI